MEKEALITAMKDSISEVMEKMFFLPLDFSEVNNVEELWDPEKDEIVISKLNFNGPFSGFFFIFIPRELALSLAAGFMGINDDEISKDHITEAAKEILNMIAGSTFSIFDQQAVFDLDIPELIGFDKIKAVISDSDEEIFIAINTLDNCLAFKMVLHSS